MSSDQSSAPSNPASRSFGCHRKPSNVISQTPQERRRKLALEAQKERRQHAFIAARTGIDSISEMESAILSMEDEDEATEDEVDSPKGNMESENSNEPQGLEILADSVEVPTVPKLFRNKRTSKKSRYKPWAKGLLMHAETLDLRHGLPISLDSDWLVLAVPKGKRCLCATVQSAPDMPNSVLYSRVSGRTLQKVPTVLPGDCLLDCIFDKDMSVIWLLDVIKWTGQFYVDCEADFRQFFLSSKLSELPLQSYTGPQASRSTFASSPIRRTRIPHLVLPVPKLLPPLSIPSLLQFSSSSRSTAPVQGNVLLPDLSNVAPSIIEIPLAITGLLLYLKQAHYESGTTTLAGWIPGHIEKGLGLEETEGLDRFCYLLLQLQTESCSMQS